MELEQALAFIHGTDWKGSRLGLERMRELMRRLGEAQDHLKFIHVAGTNGKGSTSTMLASILTAAGYKTGLYTSPHLVRVNERFRIDGSDIPDAALCRAAEAVKEATDGMADTPTDFEILTAMGFWYFAAEKCDVVVLEVGLGGRLDATNVIKPPEAAVITNIGLEHTAVLGCTLSGIAREKAGIIKPGTTAVTYPVNTAVDAVYREICAERNAAWRGAAFDTLREREHSLTGQRFDYKDEKDLTLHLLGAHQRRNAALAIETVGVLREKGWRIPESALREGLSAARWEARFELLRTNPPVIADGAHNPQCVEALARSLDEYLPGEKVVFLLGVLADKNYEAMLARLLPYGKKFFCLTPDSPRALSADALCACLRAKGADAVSCATAEEGVRRAIEESGGETPVVACGSLYLMGEIREAFLKA